MPQHQFGHIDQQVQHKYRSLKEYLADNNKSPDAVYFTADGNIFIGNRLMGTAIKKIIDIENTRLLPLVGTEQDVIDGPDGLKVEGIIYRVKTTGRMFMWSNRQNMYIDYVPNDFIDSTF